MRDTERTHTLLTAPTADQELLARLKSGDDRAYPIPLRIVRNTFPKVTAMADFGTVSETAVRIVFIGWFKD